MRLARWRESQEYCCRRIGPVFKTDGRGGRERRLTNHTARSLAQTDGRERETLSKSFSHNPGIIGGGLRRTSVRRGGGNRIEISPVTKLVICPFQRFYRLKRWFNTKEKGGTVGACRCPLRLSRSQIIVQKARTCFRLAWRQRKQTRNLLRNLRCPPVGKAAHLCSCPRYSSHPRHRR